MRKVFPSVSYLFSQFFRAGILCWEKVVQVWGLRLRICDLFETLFWLRELEKQAHNEHWNIYNQCNITVDRQLLCHAMGHNFAIFHGKCLQKKCSTNVNCPTWEHRIALPRHQSAAMTQSTIWRKTQNRYGSGNSKSNFSCL